MPMPESREDVVERIKERADIVQIIGECVDLKKSGTRFLGRCPFHGEKTPSFTVHPGQQFFHCFGCGESGDVFSFVRKYHNWDFPTALKELARRYQIDLPEKTRSPEEEQRQRKRAVMFAVNAKAAAIYRSFLLQSPAAAVARQYLTGRGVSPAAQEKFGIGYAPAADKAGWEFLSGQLNEDERRVAEELGLLVKKEKGGSYDRFRDRILFPIADPTGRVCGFGGRILGDGQPKYMNSPDSLVFNKSALLLGLYQQQEEIRRKRQAVLVEGNFDLVSLVDHGFGHVVAPLGTALTREQLRLLKRQGAEITLLFDGDPAGLKAAVRAVPLFLAEQIAGKVALLPPGHDPDTFVREMGSAAVSQLIEQAEALPEFALAHLIREHGLTLDGKNAIIAELQVMMKSAASALQRSVMVAHFAERLGLAPGQLEQEINQRIPLPEEPPKPVVQPARREKIMPLTAAQKRLLGFMILHPRFFPRLAEHGIRHCLAGSIGEVLFLQIQAMLAEKTTIEPEELLTLLPEGGERAFVAALLLSATTGNTAGGGTFGQPEEEVEEMLEWMKSHRLQESSKRLLGEISAAHASGDPAKLMELLQQKQEIDRALQGLR